MRYNRTERIGINAIEQIFIKEFDWIFREQPIVDVGIDALIEQSENGNPTGKFIALQIKSGKGNFHISDSRITYYISNIHYNYWLNFDIPVLLIAHIPELDKTFWMELSEGNIKKAKKRWKIEIPRKNQLNIKAKRKITELLTDKDFVYKTIKIFKGEDLDAQTIFDIAEKSNCIEDSNESTSKTVELLEELTEKTNASNNKFKHYNEIGQSFKSPQVVASVKTYAKNINIYSKRLENECEIFAETFAEGIYAYEQAVIIHYLITKDLNNVKESLKSLENLPSALDSAVSGIDSMRTSLSKLPNDYNSLKESKKTMLSVLDLIIREYEVARTIVIELIESGNELLKNNR